MTTATKPIDPAIQAERDERDRQLYQIAYDFIKANALNGKSFFEAAELIRVSPYHFHRNFTRLFGITPKKLSTGVQIEAVKEMLLAGKPLNEIAKACGFAHQSHMNARFKMFVKESPMRWLRFERVQRDLAKHNS